MPSSGVEVYICIRVCTLSLISVLKVGEYPWPRSPRNTLPNYSDCASTVFNVRRERLGKDNLHNTCFHEFQELQLT